MKKILLILLALSACRQEISAKAIQALKRSVTTIKILDESGKSVGGATVWAIDEDHLVTSGHVCSIPLGHQLAILTEPYEAFFLIPIYQDAKNDICVLSGNPGLTPMPIKSTGPVEGDVVWVYGSPLGVPRILTRGYAGPLTNTRLGALRQLSVASFAGNSGGVVLDVHGRVVCILAAGVRKYHHISYCTNRKALTNAARFIADNARR